MYKEKLLNFEFCSGNRKFVPEFICKIWRWFASCKAKKIYVILYVTVIKCDEPHRWCNG